MTPEKPRFNYDAIPADYYDHAIHRGSPIQKCWHLEKFQRVVECLPTHPVSVLDIGCFSGTFLSLLDASRAPRQVGVDILRGPIEYANRLYGTSFRKFLHYDKLSDLNALAEPFDCVTLIEVIEHLTSTEIGQLMAGIADLLKPGGKLILTTPNYTSAWPLLEIMLNRFSKISYEEQHLTKFNYFSALKQLREIYPRFDEEFATLFRTTSHFISPFLGLLSVPMALRLSRMVPHKHWRFPFGNLIVMAFERR